MKDTGGAAFPCEVVTERYYACNEDGTAEERTKTATHEGMTLRDYFAAAAMKGHLSRHAIDTRGHSIGSLARASYEIADAMIAERGKV